MKTVRLSLSNPDDGSKTEVSGEFSESDISTLESYSSYVENLNTSALLVRGTSGISRIEAFGPEGMKISCPSYSDLELREILMLLRPLILNEEFASFQNVQSIIKKGFKNRLVSDNMKLAMRRFESGELGEYMQISIASTLDEKAQIVGGQQLFDKSLVKVWLNSEQYHTDQEKIEKWKEIKLSLGEENVRAVTMSHVLSMVNSIKFVDYVVRFIVTDNGNS